VERVLPDRHGTEILFEYPDPGFARWFDRIAPEAAATLLTGYESIQIQEYLLLFNPLARRAFIYQGIDGTLKEARLGLPTRGVEDLAKLLPAARPASASASAPADPTRTWAGLCWQVLPRSPSEAWLVCAAETFADGEREVQAEPWPGAIPLDLAEGRAGTPIPLPGLKLPVFFDPRGRLTGLDEALDRFDRNRREAETTPRTRNDFFSLLRDPSFSSSPSKQTMGAAPRNVHFVCHHPSFFRR
jgi:hypothetical protein